MQDISPRPSRGCAPGRKPARRRRDGLAGVFVRGREGDPEEFARGVIDDRVLPSASLLAPRATMKRPRSEYMSVTTFSCGLGRHRDNGRMALTLLQGSLQKLELRIFMFAGELLANRLARVNRCGRVPGDGAQCECHFARHGIGGGLQVSRRETPRTRPCCGFG